LAIHRKIRNFAANLTHQNAEQFISGRLVYQRFSSREQHGCSAGGAANVIATILAGAEDRTDSNASSFFNDKENSKTYR